MSYERHPLEMDPSIERCSDCGEGLDYCACPDAEQQREFRARLDGLEAKVAAAKAKRAQSTTREEAAAKALYRHMESEAAENGAILISPPADEYECCASEVIAAADAHDLAHGIHRLTMDDATVERAAEGLLDHWWHYGSGKCACGEYVSADPRIRARHLTRAVLSAAVQEER